MSILGEELMTHEDVDTFEKLKAQLDSLHQEISLLAKRSPNDAVNTFKLKFINSCLEKCNSLLGAQYLPFEDFRTFKVDEVPTNSDVTFMIAQYIECAEKFRTDNIEPDVIGNWYWKIKGSKHEIETTPPTRLRNK
jgi:hypothetical protein